jgi:putative serine protease PepD
VVITGNGIVVPDGVAVEAVEEAEDGGVLIRSVTRGGVADAAGLRAGDVILSFGGVRTRSFEDLRAAVQQADGEVKVVFINGENGETEYLTLVPADGRIGVTCE